jgi:pimeloyl-ACP methyl ester carboxylesterase
MRDSYQTIGTDWLRSNFQVVTFDPRGVGESTAVQCSDDELKDEVLYGISEFEFGSDEDIEYAEQAMADFAASCQETGPSVGYFNTQQTARDMELMRQLLGAEKLDYLGFSYGTEIGASFIALFPQSVGRFVLDGAVDPTMDPETKLIGQMRGFDNALRAYLEDCLTDLFCPFEGDVDSALEQISDFMLARESEPLPTDDNRELGISATLAGVIVTLYSEQSWVYLSQAFEEAFAGDGTTFLWLADFYNDRDPGGGYLTNINEANYAINCADDSQFGVSEKKSKEIMAASPVFGKYFSYPVDSCIGWPNGIGLQDLDYAQTLEIGPLVIGTTGDPATPYEQAVSLAQLLDRAKLLTLEGEGHTAYGQNSCIDTLVDTYLSGGELGSGDLTCF